MAPTKPQNPQAENYFPTSARPIFVRLGLLVMVLIGICLFLYMRSSPHGQVAKVPSNTAENEPDQDLKLSD